MSMSGHFWIKSSPAYSQDGRDVYRFSLKTIRWIRQAKDIQPVFEEMASDIYYQISRLWICVSFPDEYGEAFNRLN